MPASGGSGGSREPAGGVGERAARPARQAMEPLSLPGAGCCRDSARGTMLTKTKMDIEEKASSPDAAAEYNKSGACTGGAAVDVRSVAAIAAVVDTKTKCCIWAGLHEALET